MVEREGREYTFAAINFAICETVILLTLLVAKPISMLGCFFNLLFLIVFKVLWPKSGWKPVPLVDIIEGNAVKRSYQKALLYLHPDKLQQKGASSEQKYMAAKVFEILQVFKFNSLYKIPNMNLSL